MPWKALTFDRYLEDELDSLNLERTYESGILDTTENVERLTDYPDPEEDARCPASLEVVTTEDEVISQSASGRAVLCHMCGQKVSATWRRRSQTWNKPTHYPPRGTVIEGSAAGTLEDELAGRRVGQGQPRDGRFLNAHLRVLRCELLLRSRDSGCAVRCFELYGDEGAELLQR